MYTKFYFQQNVDCQRSERRLKTHKTLNTTLVNRTIQNGVQILKENPLFQATDIVHKQTNDRNEMQELTLLPTELKPTSWNACVVLIFSGLQTLLSFDVQGSPQNEAHRGGLLVSWLVPQSMA